MPYYFKWKKIGNWKNIGEKLKKLQWRKSGAVSQEKKSLAVLLLRRCYLIAGIYLLVIVVVFSLMLLRWNRTPSLEFSSFEERAPLNGEHAPPPAAVPSPPAAAGDTGGHNRPAPTTVPEARTGTEARPNDHYAAEQHIPPAPDPAGPQVPADAMETPLSLFPESNIGDLPGEVQDVAVEDVPMPTAANPLSTWELYSPFGSYVSAVLPSGTGLHYLSRGVLLRTAEAAPVAALWDGVVKEVSIMEGRYRCSVLIEHSGGYSTYYGKLREVWVKAGAKVSRGEHIGLMPYRRNRETESTGTEAGLPVSGDGRDRRPGGTRSVRINTVWRGSIADLPIPTPPPAQDNMEMPPEAGSLPTQLPVGERATPSLPDSPLLYLEVRLDDTHLDPLNFIGMRH